MESLGLASFWLLLVFVEGCVCGRLLRAGESGLIGATRTFMY